MRTLFSGSNSSSGSYGGGAIGSSLAGRTAVSSGSFFSSVSSADGDDGEESELEPCW